MSYSIPLHAVSGFCLPLGGWSRRGLFVVADWVGVAGVGTDGMDQSLAISGMTPRDNSGPIVGQIWPMGHLFDMSSLDYLISQVILENVKSTS